MFLSPMICKTKKSLFYIENQIIRESSSELLEFSPLYGSNISFSQPQWTNMQPYDSPTDQEE